MPYPWELSFGQWKTSKEYGTGVCVLVCLVAQLCPTLCNPMGGSLAGSSVHGDSPGKNTEVSCHALLPSQGSNPGLPHCRQILYLLSHLGSPIYKSRQLFISALWICKGKEGKKRGISNWFREGCRSELKILENFLFLLCIGQELARLWVSVSNHCQ